MGRHFDDAYQEVASLRDGIEVRLRLVRPSDGELLRRGFDRLSPDSRYRRFFSPKAELSDQEIRYLTEVDQENHFALGAARVDETGAEEGVAVARFIRSTEEPTVAEAAIAVLDDMQGQGLGRLMFLRLVAAARERDVNEFQTELLADNAPMRGLLMELAPGAAAEVDGGVITMRLQLPEIEATASPSAEVGRGPIYRLLRLVAERMVTIRRAIDPFIPWG